MAKQENGSFQLKDYKAVSYNGQYEYGSGNYSVTGSIGASSDKVLTSLSGTVKNGESGAGSFNAYLAGDKLHYNFSNVPAEEMAAVAALVLEVEAEAKKAIQAVN